MNKELDPITYVAHYTDCDIIHGDVNGDGSIDLDDFDPFVQLLVGIP